MNYQLYHADFRDVLLLLPQPDCIFADPPDNIGLRYSEDVNDLQSDFDYARMLNTLVAMSFQRSRVLWVSFNSIHVVTMSLSAAANLDMADSVAKLQYARGEGISHTWELKPCVQTFTFGQHKQSDLGSGHRPLWRFMQVGTQLYPDEIRENSWRQLHGDSRAAPGGRVPCDVFDFPRVVGNSDQRRSWHPTQLHEGLVERCIKLTTKPGDLVIDPFAGTGTTLRVCKRIDRRCILIEKSAVYCERLIEEHKDLQLCKLQSKSEP